MQGSREAVPPSPRRQPSPPSPKALTPDPTPGVGRGGRGGRGGNGPEVPPSPLACPRVGVASAKRLGGGPPVPKVVNGDADSRDETRSQYRAAKSTINLVSLANSLNARFGSGAMVNS
ncbi:hypothetical protein [[Phormidium] sp. ETS-05]|uniref:hypothetical protein n=1 Tax=[Phormidium] sp. ETS-05 TaxID=222819 RepID=UPI0018EF137E|nr:hypothetical protein [[Phormidium] sp. ETS-05]